MTLNTNVDAIAIALSTKPSRECGRTRSNSCQKSRSSDSEKLILRFPRALWNSTVSTSTSTPASTPTPCTQRTIATCISATPPSLLHLRLHNPPNPPSLLPPIPTPKRPRPTHSTAHCSTKIARFHYGGPGRALRGARMNDITLTAPCLRGSCARCRMWHKGWVGDMDQDLDLDFDEERRGEGRERGRDVERVREREDRGERKSVKQEEEGVQVKGEGMVREGDDKAVGYEEKEKDRHAAAVREGDAKIIAAFSTHPPPSTSLPPSSHSPSAPSPTTPLTPTSSPPNPYHHPRLILRLRLPRPSSSSSKRLSLPCPPLPTKSILKRPSPSALATNKTIAAADPGRVHKRVRFRHRVRFVFESGEGRDKFRGLVRTRYGMG
ncbi:hypothetical protein BDV95DRAFT_658415 [Massariosphaeria phaeospora]|uniref:Uncharacterized protein n=1 Tax=Massariosphaeria phaeospora TaxID=100035 RepID=A0A7C8I9S4_9PLEO|nr:hypothetical protein BDV95DRAFT_658415 [Massariosphaeria phaeospora]